MEHYEIASELSQQVFKRRRRRGELGTPPLDEANRIRYASLGVTRVNAIPASNPSGVSREAWDALRINRRNER